MCSQERWEARERVKAQLSQYVHIKGELAQIGRLIADLEGTMTAPGTSKWDGMPRSGGACDPMVGSLVRKDLLIERYRRKDAELTEMLYRIETMLETLTPKERELMRHRYVEGMSWEAVCVAMAYSWRQTHRIHAGALDKLVQDRKEYWVEVPNDENA